MEAVSEHTEIISMVLAITAAMVVKRRAAGRGPRLGALDEHAGKGR